MGGYTAKLPVDDVLPPAQIRASIRWEAGVLFDGSPDMKRTLKAVNSGTANLSDERTLTSLLRLSSPNLFTDGVYLMVSVLVLLR